MLIRPRPYPEELDRGYLGRVVRFNSVASEKEFTALASEWFGIADKSRREVSCLELLSMVAGLELQAFVAQHTTLPLRRGITSYQPELPHGCESKRSMLWTTGMRQARTGAYFCIDCTHEDQEFHGQSYWRREHQTPGLLWCPKHATPLRYIETKDAFLIPPTEYLPHCQSVSEEWVKEARENQFIQRYLDICSSLMERETPLNVKSISSILKERASSLGFQTCGGAVKPPLLSDAVVNQFGRPWLATVLPVLADKPPGKRLSQLDGVLYLKTSASSTFAYVLACAVLYESADDAINALTASATRTDKRVRLPQLNDDALVGAYIRSHGKHVAVANQLSTNKQTTTNRLRALGLPNLGESATRNILKAAIAFFIDGESLSVSAAKGGISTIAMEDLLRASGVGLAHAIREMQRPSGRGTGVRRPRPLTPREVNAATGQMAVKFSPRIHPEQRLSHHTDIDAQKDAQ